ncbi:MAG: UvrD-helicase domain-containing protein, partial [Mariprofundus sp.]
SDVLMQRATALLARGANSDVSEDDTDELRQRLIAGFRFILVDEYQDINQAQCRFLSALAGRTLESEAEQLTMFAVGDDDQNIYEWNGAENRYIHQFATDYHARIEYMTENYRSCAAVIQASNRLIAQHPDRLKADYPIIAANNAMGGSVRLYLGQVTALQQKALELCLDMVGNEHVPPERIAILCPRHRDYQALASLLRSAGLPLCLINKKSPYRWERLREVHTMLSVLDGHDTLTAGAIRTAWLAMPEPVHLHRSVMPLWDWLAGHDTSEDVVRPKQEWRSEIWELAKSESKKTGQGIWLGTMHSVKGLEFERVIVFAGQQHTASTFCEDLRLRYVAMTRAEQHLVLMQHEGNWFTHLGLETESLPLEVRESPLVTDVYACGMDAVDMDFAGRLSHAVDTSMLHEQDQLEWHDNRGEFSWNGQVVGKLSRQTLSHLEQKKQQGWHIDAIKVQAIVRRQRSDISAEQYLARCKQDEWHVILPEIHLHQGYGRSL